jgi:hypothetical protein
MQFPMPTLDAIGRGEISVAFRRWKRPTVKLGGTLITRVGVLSIDALDMIEPEEITTADALRAGHASPAGVLAAIGDRSGPLYRVRFHVAGPDPRLALRERAELGADDIAMLTTRLGRLDARPSGPWTRRFLTLIGERPAVRAGDLADAVGMERLAFKTDVRKLKALGLTESLEVGYRLSPRGHAWLAHLAHPSV